MPAMTLILSPMPNTEQQAQLATDELIATAQALMTQPDMPKVFITQRIVLEQIRL